MGKLSPVGNAKNRAIIAGTGLAGSLAKAAERFCLKSERPFRHEYLEHIALLIHSPPEVVGLAIDPYKHFIKVPAPVRMRTMKNTTLSDLGGKHRTEPGPPNSHRLVADIDITFEHLL